ncbi:MAG: DUF1553 domain-containing protein [Planctomycetales bacterium]|nr:DUF1553 domain-containing protein [Planctomycetales bacterium]
MSVRFFAVCVWSAISITTLPAGDVETGNRVVDDDESGVAVAFNREIRPILAENCYACHGFDEASREADLRLDTLDEAIGSDSGSAIVPGKPQESEFVSRILSEDSDLLMPPPDTGKQLTEQQKQTLRRWVQQGAHYDAHWAFTPPKLLAPPIIAGVSHPIDRFIHARLNDESIRPSARAGLETLIRRVSLDLTGLPPTPEQIDVFVRESETDASAAYRELVDRLLASPHYGERWGRWWLDQARYADSNGYSIDGPRSIWKYRDWVVDALNQDMRFDTFTIEQLAGDLLPQATQSQKVATGFHRNTQINQEGGIDTEQFRVDSIFDRVATTGTVWLGLTIGCAQCHDHKFDPITQVEYYRMFAFLNNQDEPTMKVYQPNVDVDALASELKTVKQTLTEFLSARNDQIDAWGKAVADDAKKKLPSAVRKALDTEDAKRSFDHKRELFAEAVKAGAIEDENGMFESLTKRYTDLDDALNKTDTTLVLSERSERRKSHVLIKGDFTRPADEVSPGTPSILHPLGEVSDPPNRLDLARWITRPENPLTSRVIVNRIWQQYFGRGLSEIENDFGLQGAPPSHPELLDWLALEFIRQDWSLKQIHRLIVTSQTYQQASTFRKDLQDIDPDNYLLARQQRLRLDAEIVRDVALVASGLLAPKLGGPPVFPPIPDGVMSQGQVRRSWETSRGDDRYRRGIYTFKFRATPPPSLNVFDAPDGFSTCTRRIRSNTPLQALTLMNDPAYFEFATALQKIIQQDGIQVAFRRCTSRPPTDDELAILDRLDTLGAARALLNLDETITRE